MLVVMAEKSPGGSLVIAIAPQTLLWAGSELQRSLEPEQIASLKVPAGGDVDVWAEFRAVADVVGAAEVGEGGVQVFAVVEADGEDPAGGDFGCMHWLLLQNYAVG
jgi:hypothetical protein